MHVRSGWLLAMEYEFWHRCTKWFLQQCLLVQIIVLHTECSSYGVYSWEWWDLGRRFRSLLVMHAVFKSAPHSRIWHTSLSSLLVSRSPSLGLLVIYVWTKNRLNEGVVNQVMVNGVSCLKKLLHTHSWGAVRPRLDSGGSMPTTTCDLRQVKWSIFHALSNKEKLSVYSS